MRTEKDTNLKLGTKTNMLKKQDKKISLLLEDLSSLEDYVHDLFTFSPLPICFISPLGVILEANPAFEEISNVGSGDIVGESIDKLFDEKEISALAKDTFKKGFVGGREIQFSPEGKKSLACQAFTKTRKDEQNRPVGYFIGIFDLTKVKMGEEELRSAQSALLNILEDTEEARQKAEEEKNKTQAIVTSFIDGLLVFDKSNLLVSINPQAERFLDIKAEKILGESISKLTKIKGLEGLVKILGKTIKKVFRKEWEIEEDFVLEVSTISLVAEKEKAGTLVVLHDITREKIIERLKTEFVSISAHQLRTPLSAIKWTLRMLLDGDLGEITNQQREFLEKTYSSNERMISLINSLLNVTRIEEGRFLYRPVIGDIVKIVESVIETLRGEIKRKEIKLVFHKPKKPLPKVLVDVEKISLAIQNLMDNAIRYTLAKGKVSVFLKQTNGNIEFKIEDTGVGIPKSQEERIFGKFFRGTNVIRLDTQGSGLGLFITKNTIEAHGGRIWFESKEGQGTTFYFTLPVKKEIKRFLETF